MFASVRDSSTRNASVAGRLTVRSITPPVSGLPFDVERERAVLTDGIAPPVTIEPRRLLATISPRAQRVSQIAFLHLLKRGHAYQTEAPTLWDVDFRTAVAQAELAAGDLRPILVDHAPPPVPLHLLFQPSRLTSPNSRVFVDYLVERWRAADPFGAHVTLLSKQ